MRKIESVECCLGKRSKKILVGMIFLFLCLILTITFSANVTYDHEIKSVSISSDGWNENENKREPGSWNFVESAAWTGLNKTQIQVNIDTTSKLKRTNLKNYDVVLTLDVSTSMAGEKFTKLKENTHKYINEILKTEGNRVAIVEYHSTASVLTGFTNDADKLNQIIENLKLKCESKVVDGTNREWGYCTNYYDGLVKTQDILESYTSDENRQLVVLFLTDGVANRDTGLIKSQYDVLKDKFPDSVISGIQYEMGSNINKYLKLASDYQYDADMNNLYERFYEATYRDDVEKYGEFEVTETIAPNFYVESTNDISVNKGRVELAEENGEQKIIWTIKDKSELVNFNTGANAKMFINATYKGQSETKAFYPTNGKKTIKFKLEDDEKVTTNESEKTPVLQNVFEVKYNPNLPSDCKNLLYNTNIQYYQPFQVAKKNNGSLACDEYVFRGWEYTEDANDVKKISDNMFTMPAQDVEIRGVWGTLNISKSSEGQVAAKKGFLYDVVKNGAVSDKDIDFKLYSSATNGRGNYFQGTEEKEDSIYYYRGAVTNNNVLFAGFCWKIVRTTETGGIKLLYNGIANGNKCTDVKGNASVINGGAKVAFNLEYSDAKYLQYVYDNEHSSTVKLVVDDWYKENIEYKGYSSYLEDTIWCSDKSSSKLYGNYTWYGFALRVFYRREKPILTCENDDSYTVDSSKGNGLLTYPVALLTGDEAQMAGQAFPDHNNRTFSKDSYTQSDIEYWLLSPWTVGGEGTISSIALSRVMTSGGLSGCSSNQVNGVRPTISLKPDTLYALKGSGEEGSITNPYIIVDG